ncbi:MAG: tRNA epoxyqueuosine(34) reductase QueG [Vicinamibacterales bacterium]
MVTAAALKAQARAIGFDLCGIAPVGAFPELSRLESWLENGHAGSMDYLARSADARRDVRRVMPSARSVIVTGTLYNTDRAYSTAIDDPATARVARYAWGDDYHDVLAARLDRLVGWMRAESETTFDARAYVDTGPVQERVYAQYGGLGWIGKNTCLINPELGSWLFLAEIVCSLELETDRPGTDHCGTCRRCLEACPTGALVEPAVLDATRCLSYLTIEHRDVIPEALRPSMGPYVFGCDICQDVCPWNRDAPISTDPHWLPREALDRPRTRDLFERSDAALRDIVRGGAMMRASGSRLRRNLAVALGCSDDPAALDPLAAALGPDAAFDAPTLADPLVQDHVVWALRRLGHDDDEG